MIHFANVFKRYPGNYDALKGINFHLERGEMAFLTGHSGAGKSTLLKLITLIERATRWFLRYGGRPLDISACIDEFEMEIVVVAAPATMMARSATAHS